MIRIAAAVIAIALAGAPAAAQDARPDTAGGRYTLHPVGEEFMRLDGRTGEVSVCSRREVGWSCLAVPDERTALEAEIGRLQNENAALKRELIARGLPLPGGARAPEPAPKSEDQTLRLPSDEDLDRMTAFLEKVWRRLVDMVQTMQKETEKKSE